MLEAESDDKFLRFCGCGSSDCYIPIEISYEALRQIEEKDLIPIAATCPHTLYHGDRQVVEYPGYVLVKPRHNLVDDGSGVMIPNSSHEES
jgi:hypothetical protein